MNVLLWMMRYWRWVVVAAIVAAATFWHFSEVSQARVEGREQIQKLWNDEKLVAAAKQAEIEANRKAANEQVIRTYKAESERYRRERDALRADADGLRELIARRSNSANTTPSAGVDGTANPVAEVAGQCVREYAELADAAREAVIKLIALQQRTATVTQ